MYKMKEKIIQAIAEAWLNPQDWKDEKIRVKIFDRMFLDWDFWGLQTIGFNIEDNMWNTIKEWLWASYQTELEDQK